MVFIVSTEQKVADFVFVSVKLNQDKNTSVVITERLNECKGVREIVCGPICSSVFHCVFVCLCSMWVLGWMSLCVFETFSLFLWINMCFCMVCSPVQHVWLSQRDSKLSFFHTWSTKQDCVCVHVFACAWGPAHKSSSTPRWPKRSVLMVPTNPCYSSRENIDPTWLGGYSHASSSVGLSINSALSEVVASASSSMDHQSCQDPGYCVP